MRDMSGFVIAVDHHEQNEGKPFRFHHMEHDVPTKIVKLGAGTYSVVGYEDKIVVMRKNPEKLFLGCGTERHLFENDLAKLTCYYGGSRSAHLVLECTLYSILFNPPAMSQMKPKSVMSSLTAWSMRYGFKVWPCDSRRIAERMTLDILERWYRDNVLHEHDAAEYDRARKEVDKYMAQAYTLPGNLTSQPVKNVIGVPSPD